MTKETIEQLKAHLKREDEEKERAFQKTLEGVRESQAPFRAEQEAKKRTEEAERQKLLEDARAKRVQEMQDSARRSWITAGGTDEEFEREWPDMRMEMLRRRTLEDDAKARDAMARSSVSRI